MTYPPSMISFKTIVNICYYNLVQGSRMNALCIKGTPKTLYRVVLGSSMLQKNPVAVLFIVKRCSLHSIKLQMRSANLQELEIATPSNKVFQSFPSFCGFLSASRNVLMWTEEEGNSSAITPSRYHLPTN